jgi:ribonucleoside-diphosphate reductase alpha chain
MIEDLVTTTKRLAITPSCALPRTIGVYDVMVDDSRDALLTEFGKATLKERYLSPDESYQDRFANSVRSYCDDADHAQRMYDYISKLWCMPPTPILSNGGTTRGNLISCFLNSMDDSLEGIFGTWGENAWLGAKGGGLGTYVGKIRSDGEKIQGKGKSSGLMSFLKVNDAQTACINQAGNRRANGAVYCDITHPEIEHFIMMRMESGGDPAKKAINLHHGVILTDSFYEACKENADWDLISPHTGLVLKTVSARGLMQKILQCRMAKGEPYILNIDTVNRAVPEHHRRSKLLVTVSNLCTEITLPTGKDHHGVDRTAVCALFQFNMETYDEWQHDPLIIEDVARFMDNVLQDFIDNAGEHFVKSRYSAMRERSIGVGAMGFHSFLQKKGVSFESAMAKAWNIKFFKHLREGMDVASIKLAHERGACPDAAEHGIMERFSYKLALAPTASSSIICGGASPGGDLIAANIYTEKTVVGSVEVRNKYFEAILEKYGHNDRKTWKSILDHGGSVQHLDFVSDHEKSCYKTSFETNPRWCLEHAGDRTPYICQAQSLNLFVPPDIDKYDLLMLHMEAWERGIKSLYYLRSFSIQSADATDGAERTVKSFRPVEKIDYTECLACS